jgi:hypothetical protein
MQNTTFRGTSRKGYMKFCLPDHGICSTNNISIIVVSIPGGIIIFLVDDKQMTIYTIWRKCIIALQTKVINVTVMIFKGKWRERERERFHAHEEVDQWNFLSYYIIINVVSVIWICNHISKNVCRTRKLILSQMLQSCDITIGSASQLGMYKIYSWRLP